MLNASTGGNLDAFSRPNDGRIVPPAICRDVSVGYRYSKTQSNKNDLVNTAKG